MHYNSVSLLLIILFFSDHCHSENSDLFYLTSSTLCQIISRVWVALLNNCFSETVKIFLKLRITLPIDLFCKLEFLTVDTRVILSRWNILGKGQEYSVFLVLLKGCQFQLRALFKIHCLCLCWSRSHFPRTG